jgi:hypothetical protein
LRDQRLADLSAEQDLVLSRGQLGTLAFGRQLIARRVKAGRWQVVGPHVVVLHSGPLSRRQQYWAGVLHAGEGAALGSLTALEAEGFTGLGSPEVHVVAPHGTARRDLVTDAVVVRVTESRHLPDHDFMLGRRPPRARQERATIDAASMARSDRACRAILAAATQQRIAAPTALRARVLERPNLRRHALILETLDDVEGGSQSLPELEYVRGLRRHRLPLPTRQRVVKHVGGRYYLDADFEEWLVTVEINGAQHLSQRQKELDDIRRSRLGISGRLVVDIGSHTVRHDIELAVLLTADALLSRGWRPAADVRSRLLRLAAAHPTFSWTSSMAA